MICWDGYDEKYQKFVQTAIDELKPHVNEFDGIVSAGLSGLLVAAPVAFALKVPLGVIRRQCDGKHGGLHANLKLIKRALFIDDHFGGGNTFRACREGLVAYASRAQMSLHDLRLYEREYGKAYCEKNWPGMYEKKDDHEIVAIYMYNKGQRMYDGYHHVTSPSMEQIQRSYALWPTDVYEKLHDPSKSKVKKVVKKVARDSYGRFAPTNATFKSGRKVVTV